MSQRHTLIGTGLYDIERAAQLVGADLRSVRRWLKGYSRKTKHGITTSPPLWQLQYWDDERIGSHHVLGFKDLMELRVVTRFIEQGVPLQTVRATIDIAREVIGPYPLQSKRFLSDGRRIFMDAVEGSCQRGKLLDVRGRQFVFGSVIRPSLFDDVEFDAQGHSVRWFPVPKKRLIVVDPARQFGQSVLLSCNVTTTTLHDSFVAEKGDREFVAGIWQVTEEEVMAAVRFEKRMQA